MKGILINMQPIIINVYNITGSMKPELFSVPDVMFNLGMSIFLLFWLQTLSLVLSCVFVNRLLDIDEMENAID